MTSAPTLLDTPPDWHAAIARRQADVARLGYAAAIRLWRDSGEMSRAVLDQALADLAAQIATEAAKQ